MKKWRLWKNTTIFASLFQGQLTHDAEYRTWNTEDGKWEIKMEKISLNDHYTRLYGPDLMVKQKKVQDMLSVEKISKKLCKILEE